MKITRLELVDYKCFEHLVLEDLGDRVVLVGPNGCGKSTILEAIATVKEFVSTYDPNKDIYRRRIPLSDRHTNAWHPNLALPIRAAQPSATVRLDLVLNEAERAIVDDHAEITASIQIHRTSEVTSTLSNPKIAELFRLFEPGSGVGIFDYISPQRHYQAQQVRNFDAEQLSINQQRKERIELPNPGVATSKFNSVKLFIIGQQINELTSNHRNQTKNTDNSIKLLQELFAEFFFPKNLIGTMTNDFNGELQVVVETPNGEHDIDQLSSGEKELFYIFTSLFRIRNFPAVILYDEPERHLNPGLESKIIPALDKLQTQNQLWIATHSTEMIGSVPLNEIVALPRVGRSAPERFFEESKTARVRLFEGIGASVGLQLSSNRIVFLEGKEASSDKYIIEKLVGTRLPGVLFIASGAAIDVQGSATRASLLIEKASSDTAFMMVLDRDYRDEDSVKSLSNRLNNRVFIWSFHEVENLLLDAAAIWELLQINDRKNVLISQDKVKHALRECAKALEERFTSERAAYRLHATIDTARNKGPQDEVAYYDMVRARREKFGQAYSDERAKSVFERAKADVENSFQNESWLKVLPGKAILGKFRSEYLSGMPDDYFRNQILGFMVKNQTLPAEIERLIEFINSV